MAGSYQGLGTDAVWTEEEWKTKFLDLFLRLLVPAPALPAPPPPLPVTPCLLALP